MVQQRTDIRFQTSGAAQAVRDIQGLGATAQKSFRVVNDSAGGAAKGLGSVSQGVTTVNKAMVGGVRQIARYAAGFATVAAGAAAFRKAAGGAADFELQLANASTLVDTSVVNIAKLRKEVLALPPVLGSAADLTKGLYQALSASVEPAEAVKFVGDAARFATAGLTDTFTAVDVLTSAINAYGLAASDATAVSDIFFKTVELGKISAEQLAQGIGTIIPFAEKLEIPLEEVAAGLATLTTAGIPVDQALTSMRSSFANFIQEADKFRDVGIDIVAAIGKRGLVGGLEELDRITKGNIESIREFVPDIRALLTVLGLGGKNLDDFRTRLGKIENATGATAVAFDKISNTASVSLRALGNQIDRLVQVVAPPFLDFVTKASNSFVDFVQDAGGAKQAVFDFIDSISNAQGQVELGPGGLFAFDIRSIIDTRSEVDKLTDTIAELQGKLLNQKSFLSLFFKGTPEETRKAIAETTAELDALNEIANRAGEEANQLGQALGESLKNAAAAAKEGRENFDDFWRSTKQAIEEQNKFFDILTRVQNEENDERIAIEKRTAAALIDIEKEQAQARIRTQENLADVVANLQVQRIEREEETARKIAEVNAEIAAENQAFMQGLIRNALDGNFDIVDALKQHFFDAFAEMAAKAAQGIIVKFGTGAAGSLSSLFGGGAGAGAASGGASGGAEEATGGGAAPVPDSTTSGGFSPNLARAGAGAGAGIAVQEIVTGLFPEGERSEANASALSFAAGGAGAGAIIGGPLGSLIGGIGGLILGSFLSEMRREATLQFQLVSADRVGSQVTNSVSALNAGDETGDVFIPQPDFTGPLFRDTLANGQRTLTSPFGEIGIVSESNIKTREVFAFLESIVELDEALADLLSPDQIDEVTAAVQFSGDNRDDFVNDFGQSFQDFGTSLSSGDLAKLIVDRAEEILEVGLASSPELLDPDVSLDQFIEGIFAGVDKGEINEVSERFEEFSSAVRLVQESLDPEELTQSEKAIEQINAQFDDMVALAEKFGLSVEAIEALRLEDIAQVAIDFEKSLTDGLLGITDPLALANQKLDERRDLLLLEAESLDLSTGIVHELVDAERALLDQRAASIAQAERLARLEESKQRLEEAKQQRATLGGFFRDPALIGDFSSRLEGIRVQIADIEERGGKTVRDDAAAAFAAAAGFLARDFANLFAERTLQRDDPLAFALGELEQELSVQRRAAKELQGVTGRTDLRDIVESFFVAERAGVIASFGGDTSVPGAGVSAEEIANFLNRIELLTLQLSDDEAFQRATLAGNQAALIAEVQGLGIESSVLNELFILQNEALEAQIAAAKAQEEAAEAAQDTSELESIESFLSGLITSPSSPLSPQAVLGNARRAFAEAIDLGDTGDVLSTAQNFLSAGREVFASSSSFFSIFDEVRAQVGGFAAAIASDNLSGFESVRDEISAQTEETTALLQEVVEALRTSGVSSAKVVTLLERVTSALRPGVVRI